MGLKAPNQRVPKKLLEVLGKGRGEGGLLRVGKWKNSIYFKFNVSDVNIWDFFHHNQPPFSLSN